MRVLFLVGAPRSGTTWLQLLLHQHPRVATVQETHVVEWYLERLQRRWDWEPSADARGAGLRSLLSASEFDALQRQFLVAVMERIADTKPGADIVLEKTPAHILSWRLIRRILPEAHFLHLIRDPRAVAASLMRASRTWAASWAPRSAFGAARVWAEAVGQRAAMDGSLGAAYREVRYEELRADPIRQLGAVHQWLGLGNDPDMARSAIDACAVDRLHGRGAQSTVPWDLASEPAGFYRAAPVDEWRKALRRRDILTIEHVNRAMMLQLAYDPVTGPEARPPLQLRLAMRRERVLRGALSALRRYAPGLMTAAERLARG